MEKFYPYMFCMNTLPPPVNTCSYYDYLVVVDFEATCDDNRNGGEQLRPIRSERPEIIQFPAVLVDVRNMVIVDYFDSIVKPLEQPVLSKFCTSLTGITQSMVDKASTFPRVIRRFERWLKKHGLGNAMGHTFALVADGSYDMGHFLYKQTLISNLHFPNYARRWVNIRTIFSKFYGQRWYSLKSVLELLGQPFEGRQHNGLDDAKNIAKVLLRLLMDGCIIAKTEKILLSAEEQEKNETRILNDKHAGKYDLATVQPAFGHECIYMFPQNVIYRHPEDDLGGRTPQLSEDNKENVPSKIPKKGGGGEKRRNKKKSSSRPDYASVLQGTASPKAAEPRATATTTGTEE